MRSRIWTILFVLLSAFIYYKLSFYFRLNIAYKVLGSLGSGSKNLFPVIVMITDTACAIVTSVLTALPCGYLVEYNKRYIATILSISILAFPVASFFMQTDFDALAFLSFGIKCITVVISVCYFTNIGCRARCKQENQ